MNLAEFQPFVAAQIAAHPQLAAAGLVVFDPEAPADGTGILLHDGTYPKVPGREESLATHGLCIVVDMFESLGVIDSTVTGAFAHKVLVAVLVEENIAVNRAAGGTGILCETAAQMVAEAVIGKPTSGPRGSFMLDESPFENRGILNGTHQLVVRLVIRHTIKPV